MNKRIVFATGVVLIFVLALAGCSSTPEPLEITVIMSEFAFEPVDLELQVGQEVTINFINNGVQEHEFMVGKDVDDHDGFPNGFEEDFFEAAGVEPVVVGGMGDMDMGDDDGDDHDEEGDTDMEDDHEDGDGDDHDEDADMEEEMDMEEDDGHGDEGHSGFMISVAEGDSSSSIQFTVTEDMVGEWEIGCFLQEGTHYDEGMHGSLVVTN